jgi:hypothetical protein
MHPGNSDETVYSTLGSNYSRVLALKLQIAVYNSSAAR